VGGPPAARRELPLSVSKVASAVVWTASFSLVCASFGAHLPFWVIAKLFGTRRKLLFTLARRTGRAIVAINPFWDVRVEGSRRLPPGTFVICANHLSNADVFCMTYFVGQWRHIAKRSLLKVPMFGSILLMGGHVPVERGETRSGEEALARCRDWLERGVSVCFYPEGTRSETGELGPFKMGAFKIAVETQCPILPIAISGTQDALPKHGWVMRRRVHVKLRQLAPILPGNDPAALRDRTREAIAAAKRELEA
jgi:1-acyl-sn-glycerol-3-phosphate acyltransferase